MKPFFQKEASAKFTSRTKCIEQRFGWYPSHKNPFSKISYNLGSVEGNTRNHIFLKTLWPKESNGIKASPLQRITAAILHGFSKLFWQYMGLFKLEHSLNWNEESLECVHCMGNRCRSIIIYKISIYIHSVSFYSNTTSI